MKRLSILLLAACGGGGGGPDGSLIVEDAGPGDQPRFVELIRSVPYTKLVIEIESVPGQEPRTAAELDLVAGLGNLLDKPGGITVVRQSGLTSQGTDHAWTFAELDALAQATFDAPVDADTIKMHALFVDGHYEADGPDGRVLGIAWSHTHLVMFKQTIESTCSAGGVPPLVVERLCERAELSIWTHETGHLIGLVDNGLPMVMDHRDPDPAHGAHDADDQCVMYYAYDGERLIDLLVTRFLGGNEDAMGFDPACLADVAAVRDAP